MVGLQYLDLSSNRIASIEEDAWSMLSLVQRVSLDYNRIESLPLSNTTTNNVITTVGNPINPVEPPSKMFESKYFYRTRHTTDLTYWKDVYLGCWSCARDYSTLCKLGITHVLTVAIELKPPFSDTLSYKVWLLCWVCWMRHEMDWHHCYHHQSKFQSTTFVKARTSSRTCRVVSVIEPQSNTMWRSQYSSSFSDFIEEGLTHGSVLVHCAAGMSRSASVMTAYTMKRGIWYRD